MEIFEVASLHAEGDASERRAWLSPLGPKPLVQLAPTAEAAVAASGLIRGPSGGNDGLAPSRVGSTAEALAASGSQDVAGAPSELQAREPPVAAASGAGEAQGQGAGGHGGMLELTDRLMSMASTSAAPLSLLTHTPMIGGQR